MSNIIEPIKTEVHNHGHVILVDFMGGDQAIVDAARLSYGQGTVKRTDSVGLIRYLMRHRHTSPFEMVELKFQLKMPIFVARQWIRTRTANVNEMSLRYSQPLDLYYVPAAEHIATQASDNKQGRGVHLEGAAAIRARALFIHGHRAEAERYAELADDLGVARELARTVLPVSLYTQWVWKIDLHNLLHFLELRLDPHAQYEIRVFAEAMATFVRAWCPWAWEAFEEYTLGAVTFSASERRALTVMHNGGGNARYAAEFVGLKGRELTEFLAKLEIKS